MERVVNLGDKVVEDVNTTILVSRCDEIPIW